MVTAPGFRRMALFFTLSMGVLVLTACSSSEERAESHYQRGLELVEEGDLTKASLEFRNALKLKADHVDALFAFGELQERQGEMQSAFRVYGGVAEQDSGHVRVRLKLVYMLLTANQPEQARKYLDEVDIIAPNDPRVLVAKATFELRSNNLQDAEILALKALDSDPDLEDAYIVLASARLVSDDPGKALEYLEAAPEASRNNVGLQILKLSVLERFGDDAKIEAQFAEMVESFPDSPRFAEAWVQWYMNKDRVSDAEQVMRSQAEKRRDDNNAQMRLVSFVLSQKGAEAAGNELEEMIEVRKKNADDPFGLQAALAQLKFASEARPDAIEYMQSVLAEARGTEQESQALLMLATMLAETGESDQAEGYLAEIFNSDSKNVDALRLRASIKLSKNENASAADDILLALNEAPNDARLRVMLAGAHERNGSSVLAEEEYAKAFSIDNQSPETGLPMVRYLLRHGRAAQAERVLETIRTRHPTNQRVLALLAQQKLAKQDFVGAQEIADLLRNSSDKDFSGFADRITAAALGAQNKHDESLNFLKDSMDSTQKESRHLLPDLIRAYVQAGQQNVAIEKLHSALDEDAEDVQARILLGSVYMSIGDTEKAEEALKRAAESKKNAAGNTALAQFYISKRQSNKAIEAIRAGLEKDENSNALQLMLTTIYQQEERFDEAIEVYEKMFKKDPGSTVVANDLASLLSERRGDEASLDRALEIAQRFRTSEIPQYQDTLGWIYYLKGEYSSALPLLRASSEGLPNMGIAQFHYGMALAALNQRVQAIAALERALEIRTWMTGDDLIVAQSTVEELKSSLNESTSK